jgi:hypothetical protein
VNSEPGLTRNSFRKLRPVPEPQPIPPPVRVWTADQWALIQGGHRSRDMDDKWHAFVEDQRLYLHRSWTGMGVYQAQFDAVDGGWRITSAWVAGDHDSYRRRDDNFESAMLEALIERVLLGIHDGPGRQRSHDARREFGQ